MVEKVQELRIEILKRFPSESAFARKIGWDKQKLNKIVNSRQNPTVEDINEMAVGLGMAASDVYLIFLRHKSPNGQQTA